MRQSASNVSCGELMSGASGAIACFGGVSDGFFAVPTVAFHSAAPSEAAFLMRAEGAAARGRAARGGVSSGCHAAASSTSASGIQLRRGAQIHLSPPASWRSAGDARQREPRYCPR